MTKPIGTTPPPDAAARRRAPLILTYSVGRAIAIVRRRILQPGRAVASKVAELMVPPREAKAFEVSAICAIQRVGSGEVRTYCHNTEAQFEAIDGDNRFLKRFATIGCC